MDAQGSGEKGGEKIRDGDGSKRGKKGKKKFKLKPTGEKGKEKPSTPKSCNNTDNQGGEGREGTARILGILENTRRMVTGKKVVRHFVKNEGCRMNEEKSLNTPKNPLDRGNQDGNKREGPKN